MTPPCVIVGAGGHAAVLVESMRLQGRYHPVCAIASSETPAPERLLGVPVVQGEEQAKRCRSQGVSHFALGVGAVRSVATRQRLFEYYVALGFEPASVVHPTATVSSSAVLGRGVSVFAHAVVGPRVQVDDNVVLNTGCIVEHDSDLGAHCFVGPGAKLAGGVRLAKGCFVGIGAIVIQQISLGAGALIGAGALVLGSVRPGARIVGVHTGRESR